MTANAILRKIEDGNVSYSFFYGQQFGEVEEGKRNSENILKEPLKVSSLADLAQFPDRFSYEDVARQFAQNLPGGSGVAVFQLTHYIVIFRRMVENLRAPTRQVPLLLDV